MSAYVMPGPLPAVSIRTGPPAHARRSSTGSGTLSSTQVLSLNQRSTLRSKHWAAQSAQVSAPGAYCREPCQRSGPPLGSRNQGVRSRVSLALCARHRIGHSCHRRVRGVFRLSHCPSRRRLALGVPEGILMGGVKNPWMRGQRPGRAGAAGCRSARQSAA